MENTVQFRVKEVRQETNDTNLYFFEPVGTEAFHYEAGQFLTFFIHTGLEEVRRSYSLFTVDGHDPFPGVLVKRIPNGEVSRYIHANWKAGTLVRALKPTGRFILPEKIKDKTDVFLIAAGSGISPVFGLLKKCLYDFQETHVKLFYSNRSVSSTIFYDEIKKLEEEFSERLIVEWIQSDSRHLMRARLSRLLLEEMVEKHMRFDSTKALFYTCGPEEYMLMTDIVLKTMGFSPDHLRREIFYSEVLPAESEWEYPERTIKVTLRNISEEVTVPTGQTILDAVLKAGIDAPYNCKAGRCGACTALCRSGKVVMRYNEVLTEADEKNGLILTCTGYPVDDEVDLEY